MNTTLHFFLESPLLFPSYPQKSLHFVKRMMENVIEQCLQKPAVSSVCCPSFLSHTALSHLSAELGSVYTSSFVLADELRQDAGEREDESLTSTRKRIQTNQTYMHGLHCPLATISWHISG